MSPHSAPGPARILLVDDNRELAENLEEILEGEGYAVRLNASCAEALVAARDGFDLALVDLRLPDGDGTALAAQLKKRAPEAEVILLTGFATVESAAAAVRAGAWAYLVKPCATPELLQSVQQALRQVRLQRETRDLSRRAQVAEKLAAVGTLTAGLSHEIRNPLNAAGLQLSVLERRVRKLPEAEQEPLLQPLLLVRDEIRRLDHTLEDFLQFARPRELAPRPVPLDGLLDRVLNLLEGDAERRGIRLVRAGARGHSASGDEDRLRQVLMNLMLNALDATPRGGWVRVRVDRDDGHVELAVEDSGPGIPADARNRIFEPFFTTKATGSGLGLPIVHAIVTQHGGTIALEDGEAGGARFVVRLPAA